MASRRLNSWKDIAAYLDRDVRTLARWERDRGLPVHRVPGEGRANVFAYADEIDAWLAGDHGVNVQPAPAEDEPGPARRFWSRVATVGVAVLALTSALWAFAFFRVPVPRSGPAGGIQRIAAQSQELVAYDGSGRPLWAHRLAGRRPLGLAGPWYFVGDLGADGSEDVVASVNVEGPASQQEGGSLLRLAADGRLAWELTLPDQLRFRDGLYGPPWSAVGLSVFQRDREAAITWIVHHITWWPGMLVTFDGRGRRLATFVNSGWLQAAMRTPDGRFLLATGISNARRAYILAVLDAANASGHSPEPPGTATACLSCPEGEPVAYFAFPRTDVGLTQPFPAGGPALQTFPNGMIQIQTHESAEPSPASAIYDLSADLTSWQASVNDAYWEYHRRMERDGKLGHSTGQCPVRQGLTVERWTPIGGWQAIRVPVRTH